MIKLQIIGNLGKDCIVNEVSGRTVINFSVAHTERYKDAQGNQKDRTTWVECAYWTDKTAISPYLKKGTMVFVEGAPSADPYTNKEGQAAATLRLRVQTVQLLGSKNDNNGTAAAPAGSSYGAASNTGNATYSGTPVAPVATPSADGDDGLPF